jgi:uncharacterized protein (DUF433 family)
MTDRVEINPSVMQGKAVIRGTRIPVELLLRKLAEGAAMEDLLDAYPRLGAADIRAALATRLTPSRTKPSWRSVPNKAGQSASSRMNAAISPPSELSGHAAMMCSR